MNLDDRPHFVYRHYDAEGRLLYVGCTSNPDKRPLHRSGRKEWIGRSVRVELSEPMSRADALNEEARAVRDEQPEANVYRENGRMHYGADGRRIQRARTDEERRENSRRAARAMNAVLGGIR